ncbi:MAG: hypothetical protein NBV68_17795 [Erythrobacter sp.]|uniref:hypothetical protein n=1 Tax=Erythrobacter sp. TaxID=1042 RepID=UPI0025FA436E|nr:hypothetical protein [Erythrobacter sp.]MCM0001228.1 hypothetical protein [Erythrobacter sp.]
MTRLPDRFIEDRRLRNTARAVLTEDIDRLRDSLAEQGIASRVSTGVSSTISDRIRSGARDVLAEVRSQAGERKGLIAGIIAAIALFLARGPILEWVEDLLESDFEDDDELTTSEAPAAPAGPSAGDPE